MKKNIFALFFIFLSFMSFAQARFFVGIEAGYSADKIDMKLKTPDSDGSVYLKDVYEGNGYVFRFNLGTQHFFGESETIGLRWLASGGYGRTHLIAQAIEHIQYPSMRLDMGFGMDVLLDIIKTNSYDFGIFGGIEASLLGVISDAYTIDKDGKKNQNLLIGNPSLLARIGVSFFLNQHHRLELFTQVPFYTFAMINDDLTDSGIQSDFYKPIQLMLSYKFVF